MYKLRTFSGLLAFDAAARHGSLTLAAKELGRTQSAVSQQVKALEQQLSLTLFVRRPREISLTAAGKALSPVPGGDSASGCFFDETSLFVGSAVAGLSLCP